jgi:uncharacterized protein
MLWVLSLIDKPGSKEMRAKNQEAHTAYLKKVDHQCFSTGPLQSDDGSALIGSLWIISANSRAEAQAFADNEPFFRAGVFQSYTITRWRRSPKHWHPELDPQPAVIPT